MFGGLKFSKNSEILKSALDNKTDSNTASPFGGSSSVNDSLFSKIDEAENHAKLIIKDGQSRYVAGIKQNVMEIVHQWLAHGDSRIFTLYGKMGCGKSFFSARLYQDVVAKEEQYHVVAFSSQQIYRDTASVRNMLLSVAHQLFVGVPACRKYLTEHLLDSESISKLTEGALIAPFDGVTLQKPTLIIIDGLDEYPMDDCVTFLEALGSLSSRIHPQVKIFFTSRPESYIMSELACDSDFNCYHIEKNETQSHADCAHFVDVKSLAANMKIDADLKRQLIEKSECSLKYLDCFFNDIACNAIQVTADFIENLPRGLSQYYRDQLVRYFGDEKLTYYQTKIVPLLELLCVVLRPITIREAADILSCKESDINRMISRSGTLLWKNNQYVMLYQSESIREFLIDDRYCPERYRIDSENGTARILERLQELMDDGEDIESNMYLFNCAVDHIVDQERISKSDMMLLVRIVGCYSHKADIMRKLSARLLEKSIREIQTFIQCLYAENNQVDPLLQDAFCVRIIAASTTENRTDKLLTVLDSLMPMEEYDFLLTYGRGRVMRSLKKRDEALEIMKPHLDLSENADTQTLFQYTYFIDEACRIYRIQNSISPVENTRLHVQVVSISEQLCRLYQRKNTSLYLVLLRNLSISYDQLARLCMNLSKQEAPTVREQCAEILRTVLNLQEIDPQKTGFFLHAAATCHHESLRLSKTCQQFDSFSESRIYDLHYAFIELGSLYANKEFPGYQPEKATSYYEDCLLSIQEIALRPESHERYIRALIKVYDRLVTMHIDEQKFGIARTWLEKGTQIRELYALYHPGASSEFDRCYAAELLAKLVLKEQGIDAAESYYLTAVTMYQACCKKYDEEYVQRAPGVVYYNVARQFKNVGNVEKCIEYTRLDLGETKKMYRLFPTNSRLWDLGVTQEILSNALRDLGSDDKSVIAERIELMENAIEIYTKLETADPNEPKYQTACTYPYYHIFFDYCLNEQFDRAKDIMERYFALFRRIAKDHPSYRGLLEMPVTQYLLLKDWVPDMQNDGQLFEDCKAYLQEMELLTDEYDFKKAKYRFQVYEALRISKVEDIEKAEQFYLDTARDAKILADMRKTEDMWRIVANCYANLYLGFRKKNKDKAMGYVQKALEELDYAIENANKTVELRKTQAVLYGLLADDLKDESNTDLVSMSADLYIHQINLYFSLQHETSNDAFLESAKKAYAKLQNFLNVQESLVKLAHKTQGVSKEKMRAYIQIILNIYAQGFGGEDAQEKIEYYNQMLETLDEA